MQVFAKFARKLEVNLQWIYFCCDFRGNTVLHAVSCLLVYLRELSNDHKHFESWGTMYSCFDFGLKPAVVSCLTNALAPTTIALESCSRAQRIVSLLVYTKKKIFG